ncbi:MAG: hypothetical protein K9G60_13850 [Pseudolabrys sp.]|nr:hypothetical protein [Pseudolabrys sp.]
MTATKPPPTKTIPAKAMRGQGLQRHLDDALARIARLESERLHVVVVAAQRTPYEKFIADGHTDRDWRRRQRRIAHMQNHY